MLGFKASVLGLPSYLPLHACPEFTASIHLLWNARCVLVRGEKFDRDCLSVM